MRPLGVTPVENRLAELWSVFGFVMQGHLGNYGTFQRRLETPILEGSKSPARRVIICSGCVAVEVGRRPAGSKDEQDVGREPA